MDKLKVYEDILDQIEREHQRNQQLRQELKSEENKVIALRVANDKTINLHMIFNIKVKIFYSIFDLYNLYQNQLPSGAFKALQHVDDRLFYLVELYVSKPFQEIISAQKCIIDTQIKNRHSSASVSEMIQAENFSNPFITIVPFENSTEDAIVKQTLCLPSDDEWTIINIPEKSIDLSHHFRTHTQKSDRTKSIYELYAPPNDPLLQFDTKLFSYTFHCNCSIKHFFDAIARHAYHQFDAELFETFASPANRDLEVMFRVGEGRANIALKLTNESLKINAPLSEMSKLKRFLLEAITCTEIYVDKMDIVELQNILHFLRYEMCKEKEEQPNLEKINTYYLAIKNVIEKLSI